MCRYALLTILMLAVIGLVSWSVKRPWGVIRRRNDGNVVYGFSIEWPIAFLTVIGFVFGYFVLDHCVSLGPLPDGDRETLGTAGAWLLVTIGGLAFTKVKEKRSLRIVCLTAASIGLCLACAFKFSS